MIFIALFVVSASLNVWQFLQPKSGASLRCKDFGSYDDILTAFYTGNRGLDGDGDGVPCENRR